MNRWFIIVVLVRFVFGYGSKKKKKDIAKE